IYRWLYTGLLGLDVDILRHKGKKKQDGDTRGTFATGLSIHDRPEEVEDRMSIGHWEADSVLSPRNKSKACVATFLERKSRLYLAFKMPDRTAVSMRDSIVQLAKMVGSSLETITSDRGKEFACYEEIQESLKVPIYFADPGSPYQRGSNENANGLLREFFPKTTDFSKVSEDALVE
ncbi:IS30 family transposase, partial [Peptococcus simiae]